MEVHIISLKPQENHIVQKVFPQAKFSQAVDLREKTPQELLELNLITQNGFENLINGRKYHHELSTGGAVGLVLSFLNVLKSGSGPVLICEDDCVPSHKLPSVIDEMLLNSSDFDMAVFGPIMYQRSKNAIPSFFKDFDVLNEYFWGLHACLFTTSGRQKAVKYLEQPVDVQLDAWFSRLAMYSNFNIIIQAHGEALAHQSLHASTIQSHKCTMCDIHPNDIPSTTLSLFILIIIFYILITEQYKYRDRFYCPKLRRMIRKR